MTLGILLVIGIVPFFHRFNFRKPFALRKAKDKIISNGGQNQISLSNLPAPQVDFGVFTLVKTELLLFVRHGKKYMWIFNFIGMVVLAFLPMNVAHQIVLPILWFLQVGRLSELTSKEFSNEVHHFTFSSYRPLSRLLTSQILAASLVLILLAAPLIIRYVISGDILAITSIVLGGIAIVLFAAFLGILSKGKKLFEVLFFMISYANINGISFLDYFGGFNHDVSYLMTMASIVAILGALGYLLRNYQLRH